MHRATIPIHPNNKARVAHNGASLLCLALLISLSLLFRLPSIVNAGAVRSDATIVALQAQHLLHGQWSWWLWGVKYQGVLEPLLIALAFTLAGPRPIALVGVALVGHLILTGLIFDLSRRRLGTGAAFLTCLILVFAPPAAGLISVYPPRQWSITLFFLAVWYIDRSTQSRHQHRLMVGAAGAALLALYSDLYVLQMVPALIVLAIACADDTQRRLDGVLKGVALIVFGSIVGLMGGALAATHMAARGPQAGLTLSHLPFTWHLLLTRCLPWALSYRIYVLDWNLGGHFYTVAPWFACIQLLGATLLGAGVASGVFLVGDQAIPLGVRRLGLFGFLTWACCLALFLWSFQAVDILAARYLAPLVWSAPLALAPLTYRCIQWPTGKLWLALALAPYLAAAAANGWLSLGPYVDGARIVRSQRAVGRDEAHLQRFLEARHIHYGAAYYWLAYRMTFLWHERVILVPLAPTSDRYPPWRVAFEKAPVVAYIFHPDEPVARPGPYQLLFEKKHVDYRKYLVAGFTVFVVRRGAHDAGTTARLSNHNKPTTTK